MELWWIGQDGSVQDAFWYDVVPSTEIDIQVIKNQLGGDITVNGRHFSPGGRVQVSLLDVPHRVNPSEQRFVVADSSGNITTTFFERCTSQNPDDAFTNFTVTALDANTGSSTAASHSNAVFVC